MKKLLYSLGLLLLLSGAAFGFPPMNPGKLKGNAVNGYTLDGPILVSGGTLVSSLWIPVVGTGSALFENYTDALAVTKQVLKVTTLGDSTYAYNNVYDYGSILKMGIKAGDTIQATCYVAISPTGPKTSGYGSHAYVGIGEQTGQGGGGNDGIAIGVTYNTTTGAAGCTEIAVINAGTQLVHYLPAATNIADGNFHRVDFELDTDGTAWTIKLDTVAVGTELSSSGVITYTGITGGVFAVGDSVHGNTSTASGIIIAKSATTLYLSGTPDTTIFTIAEELHCAATGVTATANALNALMPTRVLTSWLATPAFGIRTWSAGATAGQSIIRLAVPPVYSMKGS